MKFISIDIKQLRAFSAVGRELNFLRAAEILHISQPALSQTIRQLELRLGVRLFNRTTHKVRLTDDGTILLKRTNSIIHSIESLMEEAHDLASGQQGTLRLGYLIGAAAEIMPNIIRKFSEQFPKVKILLKEYDFSAPSVGLSDNSVDVAIVRPPIDMEGVSYVPLFEENCVACIPEYHALSSASSVNITDLIDEPIIAAPGNGPWRDFWLANTYRQNKRAAVAYEAATLEGEFQAVAAGIGISITAETVGKFYKRPGVKFITIADMAPCQVSIALPKTPSILAQSFANIAYTVANSLS